jgi:FkbM family methyltransferase
MTPRTRPNFRTRISWFAEELARQTTAVENPQVLWKVKWFGGKSLIRFRGGLELPLDRSNLALVRRLVNLASLGATLDRADSTAPDRWGVGLEQGRLRTPSGIQFALDSVDPTIFAETFLFDIHFPGFGLRERNVVDAGAFVGDTALYFASLGARVHSYEPAPGNLIRLRRNLELNPDLRDRISVYAEAVGEDGTVRFSASEGGGGSAYGSNLSTLSIPSVSLRTILNRIDGAPFLLKLDVKGAEFDLVGQSAISEFSVVQIEYAADYRPDRSVGELLGKLRDAGFSRIRRFKHNWGGLDVAIQGMIHAERDAPR